MIKFENVSKVYDTGTVALRDVNFSINRGEFVFLIGSSGAGKTTVTRLLMREENVSSGSIFVDNENICKLKRRKIPYLRRKMGVVFQDFRLLPDMTVYENIEFAMRALGADKREIKKRIPIVLNQVGLNPKSDMFPRQLSGGEQQRVSLARAIINNPSVLIADEPTGNLNPRAAEEIMNIIDGINKRGTTVIMATHAHDIVNGYRKRVIQIEYGEVVRDEEEGAYEQ
ncbi:MAG: cell division ATP-binding protein FtsE [Oscillospiraceae bacterium]|nr:cell division ATP-binding protein FtsE [Oscillospiraceae bacterium]